MIVLYFWDVWIFFFVFRLCGFPGENNEYEKLFFWIKNVVVNLVYNVSDSFDFDNIMLLKQSLAFFVNPNDWRVFQGYFSVQPIFLHQHHLRIFSDSLNAAKMYGL